MAIQAVFTAFCSIWINLATILVTSTLDILLRPVVRILRRFPPSRTVYRVMKLANNGRGRIYCRQDILEAVYKLVLAAHRWTEGRKAEMYDDQVTYLPTLKVQLSSPEMDTNDDDPDSDQSKYFEAWAVFHDANLFHSYISEALAQQMKLPLHPAKWDPTLSVVHLAIKPLNYDIGVPLDIIEEATATTTTTTQEEDLVDLVVLPMEQFGRVDIRIPSQRAEDLAEAFDVPPLSPLNDCDLYCQPTADLIIGQQLYIRKFLPKPDVVKTVEEWQGLAFIHAGEFGSILAGAKGGGQYREYSGVRTVWLYGVVLIIILSTLLPLYFLALLLENFIHHSPVIYWIEILTSITSITLVLFVGIRFIMQASDRTWIHSLTNTTDYLLLKAFYYVVDRERTIAELVDKECFEYKQHWYKWIKKMISDNQLVPKLKTQLSSGGGSRSVHFEDQHEFLPEESRAELLLERKRFRPLLRVMASTAVYTAASTEVRVLLNPNIDHSLITERAVRRLGLVKKPIWPRFHWGYYPKDDDMSCSCQIVDIILSRKGPTPAVTFYPLSLLVTSRTLTQDRALPLSSQKELKANYNIELTDTEDTFVDQNVDIIIGQDLLYSVVHKAESRISEVYLKQFETALVRETNFGWVFQGFEKTDADQSDEQKATFLENLWSTFGRKG